MKTYLTSKTTNGDKRLNRIDIFLCCGDYYWSYHNEGITVETGFDYQVNSHKDIMFILCNRYGWEYIREVE